jgi:hypothetical protein
MSDRFDSRAFLSDCVVALEATGSVVTFNRDGLHLYAKPSASTTAVSCASWAALPIGLTFVADNSNGTDSMTLVPTSGATKTLTTGQVYRYTVTAAGTLLGVQLT